MTKKKNQNSPIFALSIMAMAMLAVPIFFIAGSDASSKRSKAAPPEKVTMETPSPSPSPSYY